MCSVGVVYVLELVLKKFEGRLCRLKRGVTAFANLKNHWNLHYRRRRESRSPYKVRAMNPRYLSYSSPRMTAILVFADVIVLVTAKSARFTKINKSYVFEVTVHITSHVFIWHSNGERASLSNLILTIIGWLL